MYAFALTLLLIPADPPPLLDRCDLVELNHYHDEHGKHVFDQVIFWDWDDEDCDFHVVAWRLLKGNPRPLRDYGRGDWVLSWVDVGQLRTVRGQAFRETWSQIDPEIEDRAFLAQRGRRGLLASLISRQD